MGAQGGDYRLVEVYAILVTHRLSAPDFSSMHATKFSFGGTMYLQYILTVPCKLLYSLGHQYGSLRIHRGIVRRQYLGTTSRGTSIPQVFLIRTAKFRAKFFIYLIYGKRYKLQ